MQDRQHLEPSNALCTVVFIALMVLLAATVAIGHVEIGRLAFAAAAAIATLKALLIVLFFMRVRYSSALIGLIAGAGFVWVGFLFILTLSDYLSRG